MIRSGELNKQITLQVKSITKDSYGQPISIWADYGTVWASIITTGGREFYAAQKLNSEVTAVFKIRYRRNVNSENKIKYGKRYFEILNIADPEEKHEELLLNCKEVV